MCVVCLTFIGQPPLKLCISLCIISKSWCWHKQKAKLIFTCSFPLFFHNKISKVFGTFVFANVFFPICCSELSSAPASFWQTKLSLLRMELFASELAPVCLMMSNLTPLVCQILHQLQKATSNLIFSTYHGWSFFYNKKSLFIWTSSWFKPLGVLKLTNIVLLVL